MSKEHLSVVVCGHVDAGKSTTCGHLIFKQGGISQREMDKLTAMAEEKGKSSFGFAYYLDTCKEERERGVTIQCNTKEFYTDKYHYTIVDAPGHKDYIKNMITGSATADVGLLLVPAEKGGFEAAIAKADPKAGVEEGQTRQHARLLYLLGVEQIIVGINKMDACQWDEGRFNEIKDEFQKMLQMIGFKPKKVPFIPYSGFHGDNLVEKSDKAAWYKGWRANITPKKVITGFTIVDALNNFIVPPKRHPELPLRLPISNIYNIKGVGQIICGTVEQGTLRPGDVIGIVPSGLKDKKIFSIEQHKRQLESALPGDSVGLSIKGIAKDEKVQPGDIIYVQKDGELKPIKTFTAMVAVQEHPGVLKPGYAPVVFCRTAKVACKMTKILWKMGKKTGGQKVDNPPELSQYENAEVEFEPSQPLFVEPFETCAAVISCLASRSGIKKDAYAIDYQATLNCLESGRATNARHFVLLSAYCVKNPWLQFQQAKLKFEAALEAQNDMTYSMVRPTAFFKSVSGQLEVIQQGAPFVMFGDGEVTRCNPISEADLATYLIDSITDKSRLNKIINLGGPDEPLTMKKQGEMLYKAVGKEPNFFYAPLGLFDIIIDSLQWVADTFNSEKFENAAETGRIGKYYAVEDMLTTEPDEKFGTMTLQEHYNKIAVEGQEYDPYTTMFAKAPTSEKKEEVVA